MPLAAFAQGSCIKDITYSQEFLAKYPRAPAACRQVIEANGQKWARFEAKTSAVENGQATFDFIDQSGMSVANLTFAFTPDATVEVGGRPMMASALKEGDMVTFWIPEKRFGFYAQPGALENNKFRLVSSGSEGTQKR
jgi:hypothetical protein